MNSMESFSNIPASSTERVPRFNYHLYEVTAQEIQDEFARISHGNLRIVAFSLCLVFSILSVSHWILLNDRIRVAMVVTALATALLLAVLGWLTTRPFFAQRWADPAGGMIAAIIFFNSLLHIWLTQDSHQSTNLLLLICGIGFFHLSRLWVIGTIAITWAGWSVVVSQTDHGDWIHFGFAMGFATLLALIVLSTRVKTYQRLVTLRLTEQRRMAELETALIATERAREEAIASQREVEQMLDKVQRAEERFRSFTQLEGIAICDHGDILDANPTLAEMFGYDYLEILKQPLRKLIMSESREVFEAQLDNHSDKPFEATGQRKDKTTFPVEIVTRLTTWRGSEASVVSIRDITERARATQMLRASEERYRELFEVSPLPMGVMDLTTLRFVAVNQAAIRLYGYTQTEFLNLLVTDLYLPEEASALLERIRQPRTRQSNFGTMQHRRKDGSLIKVEITSHNISWDDQPARLFLVNDVTERYRAEKELRKSEERHRQLFDISPIPMWVYDTETLQFLAVNLAAIKKYGWNREEFLSLSALDIRPLEEAARFREFVSRKPIGLKLAGIWKHQKKDGSILYVDVISDEIVFGGRKARLVLANDVTERLRADEELRESEERHRQLFEISPIPMWVFDIETLKFLAVNKAAVRAYGWSQEEFLQMTARDIRPPEEVSRFAAVASKDTGGIKNSGIWKHRRKDGSIIQVVITSHELVFAGHQARMVVANDITERKRVEEALRQYTNRLRLLREIDQAILSASSPEAIANAVLPGLKRLIPYDRATVTIFDEETREAVFLSVVSSVECEIEAGTRFPIHEEGRQRFRHLKVEIIDDLETAVTPYYNMEAPKKAGMRSYVLVPLLVGDRLIGSLNFGSTKPKAYGEEHANIARDVAHTLALALQNARLYEAERKARATAETADRLKDEFLATVSHELRTPLNAIVGWNHLLRTRNLDLKTAQRALETIERNARAQARLVNDLLDVSRIISGKLRLNVRTIDLLPIIETTIESTRPAAEARSITIETHLDSSASLISGDTDRLQQVLWNLLQNAVKFTPPDGRITIRLERRDRWLALSVSDTGQGIRSDFLPYVFERFRQADSSSTRTYGGLGLGLSIVKHLVELHGGTVRADSPGEGLGATFTVQLPLAELRVTARGLHIEGSVAENIEAATSVKTSLAGLRVLVVEDEPDTREMLKLLLEQQGAIPTIAATADDALLALPQSPPDLLLSDLAMPEHDGYWLIARVRELEQQFGKHIPAIALTAYTKAEDRSRVLAAGYQLHLPKPFDPADLVEAITRVLKREKEKQSVET